jgi:hypothetical protein
MDAHSSEAVASEAVAATVLSLDLATDGAVAMGDGAAASDWFADSGELLPGQRQHLEAALRVAAVAAWKRGCRMGTEGPADLPTEE